MSEKMKVFDPDFWKNPELWRIGKGYVDTRSLIDLAIYQTVALIAEAKLIAWIVNVLGTVDLRSPLPIAMLGTIAMMGTFIEGEDAIIKWELSRKVVEADGVNKTMLREASNKAKIGYVRVMQWHADKGEHDGYNRVRKARDDFENNLGKFAEKVIGRENQRNKRDDC